MTLPKVVSTHVYPIAGGKAWDTPIVIENGCAKYDRMFGVTEEGSPTVLRLDTLAELHNLYCVIENGHMSVFYNGVYLFDMPLDQVGPEIEVRKVKRAEPAKGIDLSDITRDLLSDAIGNGKTYRLVRLAPDQETTTLTFRKQVLGISKNSLEMINAWGALEIEGFWASMARFRPNLVFDCSAFDEDLWEKFSVEALVLTGSWLCARCIITCVDDQTGVRGVCGHRAEPFMTINKYRSDPDPNHPGVKPGQESKSFVGRYYFLPKNGLLLPGSNIVVRPEDRSPIPTGLQTMLHAA